ncbi:MFS transporter [Pseudonocardia acaciae]|uniref:MFS transporter n=1 Tax=Pseudonocardia acaciae TaxID=551276 RepID=UPI001FDEB51B|nr:MFS transporter [Pseudonocardia acaciae]
MTTSDPARDESMGFVDSVGSWAELLGRRYLGAMVVLAGGVALYATNVYVTISLLPSAIAEIGGERLYAWSTTVFLLASVVSAVLVSKALAGLGSRRAYLVALALFLAGTLACAIAPSMPVLLAGRAVQGVGAGLLAGLGYALIRSTLPARLWARASALLSAMWGVGTFVGPALGGAFAEFGSWRGAFLALAAASAGVAALVPRVLASSGTRGRDDVRPEPFPLVALVLLASAALVVSVASVIATPLASTVGVLVGLVLIAAFISYERWASVRVLPADTFRRGSRLRWIYATIGLLAMTSMTEGFIPLFGQRLAGLAPLAAGFLGAALALGWTIGELPSASAARAATIRRIIVAGPLLGGLGLALAALTQRSAPGGGTLALWVLAFLAAGAGVGIAWPHLSTAAMSSVADEREGDKASAAINTVQLVANAFGAAVTGVAVNLGEPDTVRSAHYLFGGFVLIAALGLVTAVLAVRPAGTGRSAAA